jgi:transglutaminase-like putative cysteine protease
MLKEDWKLNLVLLIFCFLLKDVLTFTTLGFAGAGTILVLLGKRPGKWVRNSVALIVFASYWLTYGKIIDPEIGLNFLTSIITLKILEKESVRDEYMIFFGLLLLISAGSLFEKTLSYVFFFSASFLILINNFYSSLGRRWKIKDLTIALAWVFPFTFILFFLVPRMLNPIPFQQNTMSQGEIGYTPDVNISDIDSLRPNDAAVFQVVTSRMLGAGELYWRANTLSSSDGWNWKENFQDRSSPEIILGKQDIPGEVKQKFRVFVRPEYFFGLNYPSVVVTGSETLKMNSSMRTIPQQRWDWIQSFEVYSDPKNVPIDIGVRRQYLQVPLPRSEKERLKKKFPGESIEEVTTGLKRYFLANQFSYSLSPGRSVSLNDFFTKKIGFCSHYASALALVLRINGIPSRLVSGFLGGFFNKYANFYMITQNDAHVWVEAYEGSKWVRIDPTEWVAPDRVRLGGDAFVESLSSNFVTKSNFFKFPKFFAEIRLWFGQWDFLFYQWLEEMDYHYQGALLSKLKIRREWIFSLIPLILVLFMLLYMWYMHQRRPDVNVAAHHELWNLFIKKMEKNGISISRSNLSESYQQIDKYADQKKSQLVREVFEELIDFTFRDHSISVSQMKKKIQKI